MGWEYSRDAIYNLEFMAESLVEDDDRDLEQCRISISIGKHRWRLITGIRFLKPVVEKCIAGNGRSYNIVHPKKYGFYIFENNHFVINYGVSVFNEGLRNTIKSKEWSCFLPWTEWKFIRHTIYDIDGAVYRTRPGYNKYTADDDFDRMEDGCELLYFRFIHGDGEDGIASAYIDEREWTKGIGLFSFIKYFIPNRISRSIECNFEFGIGSHRNPHSRSTTGCGFKLDSFNYLESFTNGIESYGCTNVRQISSVEYSQFKQIRKLSQL